MSQFLTRYVDPALDISEHTTAARLERAERERLTRAYTIALMAAEIPRRLGADATGEELRSDKRLCRRMAHVFLKSAEAWGGFVRLGKNGLAKEAAVVNWTRHCAELENYLIARRTFIATWAQAGTAKQQLWAKKAVTRINNELAWLALACPRTGAD